MKFNLGFVQNQKALVIVTIISSLIPTVLSKYALLIIDVQNCFLPGGTLPVTDGDAIIPVINNIRRKYENQIDLTVLSQDWHCENHVSFASEHSGYNPFDVITLRYDSKGNLCSSQQCAHKVNQTLWPDHCIINSTDAKFSINITRKPTDIVVRKGYNCQVDSYSAFYDNGGFSKTELEEILLDHGISKVIVTGLALDVCVYYTSKDAQKIGFDVYTVVDACRPVNAQHVPEILEDLRSIGVHVINSTELDQVVSASSSFDKNVLVYLLTFMSFLCLH